MRFTIVVFALLAACACQRAPSQLTYEGANAATQAAKIAHGKRLADVLDCTGCHGANLQGTDLADKPEDGAMFAPNISLLLSRYSDADLDRLIRKGAPKDGREFWFMPVESFQFLSDADLSALISYLRTVKAGGEPLPPLRTRRLCHLRRP